MKKLFFISFFYLFCQSIIAQTFTVGSTCCNYNLVNYQFAGPCAPNIINSLSSSYTIDIDGDLVNDITVNSYCYVWPSAGSPRINAIYLTSPNGVESVFTPSNACCANDSIIENLTFGTTFNSGLAWRVLTPTVSLTYPSYPRHEVIYFSRYVPVAASFYSGQQINPFYAGFRKILPSNDTIYGWIKMDSNMPGKLIDYAYTCGTYTAAPPTSTITTAPTAICKGDSVNLNATPSGGVFYGSGVIGNKFKSANLTSGTYTVFYALPNPTGCTTSSSALTLTVNPSYTPTLSISSNYSPSCPNQPVILSASGAGTYTWNGTTISPTISVSPSVTTIYTLTGSGPNQCALPTIIWYVQTIYQPTFAISSTYTTICPSYNIQLTATGATSYTWSTGAIGNNCPINPSVTTNYTVDATFSPGCIVTKTITQAVGVPNITASVSSSSICAGTKISLNANGAASYLWNTGCASSTCYEYPVSSTTYSVIGFGNGSCSDTAYTFINVDNSNLTLTVTTSDTLICAGDTAKIYLSGSSGGYVFQSYDASTQIITSQSSVEITPTVTTNYVIYGGVLPSGCLAAGFYTQKVSACVGINELNNNEDNFKIFPNPNNGEFEIKGNKEETIFITNELGQLISTKILVKENNYSVKLNDLQSGVYFVGNKLSRQKVVVIK